MFFSERCVQIYRDNVKKGFWNEERSFLECVALMYSEISEAYDSLADFDIEVTEAIMSEKLPGVVLFDEEVADTAIRIMDYIGMCVSSGIIEAKEINTIISECRNRPTPHVGRKSLLLELVSRLGLAIEKYRKPDKFGANSFLTPLISAIVFVEHFYSNLYFDFYGLVERKLEYNRSRPYKHGKTC